MIKNTDSERTDKDRVDFIESHTYEVHSMSFGYFAIDLSSNMDVFAGDVFFDSWRSCIDALLDINDEVSHERSDEGAQ